MKVDSECEEDKEIWEWGQALGMLLLHRWGSGKIEMVDNFAYLCSILSNDGYVMEGARSRIAKAFVPFGQIGKPSLEKLHPVSVDQESSLQGSGVTGVAVWG